MHGKGFTIYRAFHNVKPGSTLAIYVLLAELVDDSMKMSKGNHWFRRLTIFKSARRVAGKTILDDNLSSMKKHQIFDRISESLSCYWIASLCTLSI